MKHFYLMLGIYTLTILSLGLLAYYYLLMRPTLGKLETNLQHTTSEVNDLSQTLSDIKQTTDRLEARSLRPINISPTESVLATTAALISASDQDAVNQLNAINTVIDQKLKAVGTDAPIGGPNFNPAIAGLTTPSIEPTPPADTTLGFVTISSSFWTHVDVYHDPLASSKIIGQLTYGDLYPYIQLNGDWYEVRVNPTTIGWVQKVLVRLSNGL